MSTLYNVWRNFVTLETHTLKTNNINIKYKKHYKISSHTGYYRKDKRNNKKN